MVFPGRRRQSTHTSSGRCRNLPQTGGVTSVSHYPLCTHAHSHCVHLPSPPLSSPPLSSPPLSSPPLSSPCSHHSHKVVIPALRTVGNIVTGDDAQTQVDLQLVGYSDKLFNTQLKLSHSRPPLPSLSSPSLPSFPLCTRPSLTVRCWRSLSPFSVRARTTCGRKLAGCCPMSLPATGPRYRLAGQELMGGDRLY